MRNNFAECLLGRGVRFKNLEAQNIFESQVLFYLTSRHFNKVRGLDEKPWVLAPVLAYRYGWDGFKPRTLKEIGHLMGVTQEVIRQREAKTLRLIRRKFKKQFWLYFNGPIEALPGELNCYFPDKVFSVW